MAKINKMVGSIQGEGISRISVPIRMVSGNTDWTSSHVFSQLPSSAPDQSTALLSELVNPSRHHTEPRVMQWRNQGACWFQQAKCYNLANPRAWGKPKGTGIVFIFYFNNLISYRSCEEVCEPHPCTRGLQVWRHQGCAHLVHHAGGRRHALPTAPGICSSQLFPGPFSPFLELWTAVAGVPVTSCLAISLLLTLICQRLV